MLLLLMQLLLMMLMILKMVPLILEVMLWLLPQQLVVIHVQLLIMLLQLLVLMMMLMLNWRRERQHGWLGERSGLQRLQICTIAIELRLWLHHHVLIRRQQHRVPCEARVQLPRRHGIQAHTLLRLLREQRVLVRIGLIHDSRSCASTVQSLCKRTEAVAK